MVKTLERLEFLSKIRDMGQKNTTLALLDLAYELGGDTSAEPLARLVLKNKYNDKKSALLNFETARSELILQDWKQEIAHHLQTRLVP